MFLGLLLAAEEADLGDGARSLLLLTFLLLPRTAERRPGEGVLSFSFLDTWDTWDTFDAGADHLRSGVTLAVREFEWDI